jgi:glutathione synthase/RimK-type ligase-like ATP-grasp enzyme
MLKVAIVTWRGLRELAPDDRLLRDALQRRGVDACAVVWDDPDVDWRTFDAIVIRSTWDYHKRVDDFRAWLDAMEGLPLWNPPSLLRWNIHKSYLLELEARGVSIVPTLLVRRGEEMPHVPWPDVVVKPAVSATAYRTARGLERLDCDMLVQPFVPEIVQDGELSFVFLGRQFSHAVRKRASDGDFRVQTDFGGSAERFAPHADLIAQAENIAATLGEEWLYARVDCVVRDGRLLLMELEATEPSLFLDAAAAERFADAIT